MIVYYLFVHTKSVWKRKVCIIFIKNKKFKKKTKKKHFSRFFRWVFSVFLGGFFNVNLGDKHRDHPWSATLPDASKTKIGDLDLCPYPLDTVWRIRVVYPGSDFFPSRILTVCIPDPGSSAKNLSILTPKRQKVKKSHKIVGFKIFLIIFAWW